MLWSIGRRIGVLATVTALAASASSMFATPAGAETTNPCKVIKRSEIARAFGGIVASGKQGVSTPASAQCEFQVAADGERPAGTVVVHIRTTGAKAAYKGIKKQSAATPIDGVPDALWSENAHVVNVLQGDVLLGVQGGFTITNPLPIHFYDDEAQLTQLAQIGVKRV